jgi:hypothetical protein
MTTQINTADIEHDLEQLRQALQEMTKQQAQINNNIVLQRGAISYAEVLLERAKAAEEPAEESPTS